MPPTEPLQTAPRNRPRWPWLISGGLVVTAAGLWLGDVPNRYRAGEHIKSAQIALLSSDFGHALAEFREAIVLRPMDVDLHRQYVDSQVRWMQTLDRQLEGKPPEAAYAKLKTFPADIEKLLTEPQLGLYRQKVESITGALKAQLGSSLEEAQQRQEEGNYDDAVAALKKIEPFRELVPDLAARQAGVRTARVQAAMQEATALAESANYAEARAKLEAVAPLAGDVDGFTALLAKTQNDERTALADQALATARAEAHDFAQATELLDRAIQLGLKADEAAQRRTELQAAVNEVLGIELARAIARNSPEDVRKTLERGQKFGGRQPGIIKAEALTGTLDFDPFMAALKEMGLTTNEDSPGYRLDVHLVFLAQDRFRDPKPARAFLATAIQHWSRVHAEAGRPAMAGELDRWAREYGAPEDAEWTRHQLEAARQGMELVFHIRPPASQEGIDGGALARTLGQHLNKLAGGWPKFEIGTAPPAPGPYQLALELRSNLSRDDTDKQNVANRSIQYQSGTRQVTNAERNAIVDEYNDLIPRVDQLNREINDLQGQIDRANGDSTVAISAGIPLAVKKVEVNNLRNKMRDLRAQGDALPKTVGEPVYSDEPYKVITHHRLFSAEWNLTAYWNGDVVAEAVSVSASAKRDTVEVRGNASRGVPVKPESAIDRPKLNSELMAGLLRAIATEKEWLPSLARTSWLVAGTAPTNDEAAVLASYETAFRLVVRWADLNITCPVLDEFRTALRHDFLAPLTTKS